MILRFMSLMHKGFMDWVLDSVSVPYPVLEIGIGTGYALKRLSSHGMAYGIDISEESIALARKRGCVNVLQASAESIPFPSASFSSVISFDSFCYWDLDKSIPEIRRVLCDGGKIIIALEATDPSASPDWIKRSDIITIRSPEEIVKMLQSHGFSSCRIAKRMGAHAVITASSMVGSQHADR